MNGFGWDDRNGYDDGWDGRHYEISLEWGKESVTVDLEVDSEEYGNAEEQRLAYTCFINEWQKQKIQPQMLEALLRYYNEEERFSYGPDDEKEAAAWWPEINTPEAMRQALTPETLVIPPDFMQENGRRVYLLFGRTWGGEDIDDNGVAVAFLNESVEEIGYKDIVY